jgi:hypothetical protein
VRRALGALPEAGAGAVGFGVGVVVAREAPPSAEWLVDQADEAMFGVKRSGKNSVALRVVEPPADPGRAATDGRGDRAGSS